MITQEIVCAAGSPLPEVQAGPGTLGPATILSSSTAPVLTVSATPTASSAPQSTVAVTPTGSIFESASAVSESITESTSIAATATSVGVVATTTTSSSYLSVTSESLSSLSSDSASAYTSNTLTLLPTSVQPSSASDLITSFSSSEIPSASPTAPSYPKVIRKNDFEDGRETFWSSGSCRSGANRGIGEGYQSEKGSLVYVDAAGVNQYCVFRTTAASAYWDTIGGLYELSLDVKLDSNSCSVYVTNDIGVILHVGENGWDGRKGQNIPLNTWNHISAQFVWNGELRVILYASCNGATGSISMDNVIISRVDPETYTLSGPATGSELVTDGDFETGSLSLYTFDNPSASYSIKATGGVSDSAAFSLAVPADGASLTAYRDVSTVKDKVYAVSLDVLNINATTSWACSLQLALASEAGVYSAETLYQIAFSGLITTSNGVYQHVSSIITAPATDGRVVFMLTCDGNGETQEVRIDNLSVLPVS